MTQRLRFAAFAALIVGLTICGTASVRADDMGKKDPKWEEEALNAKMKKLQDEIDRNRKRLKDSVEKEQKLINEQQQSNKRTREAINKIRRQNEPQFLAPFPFPPLFSAVL